MFIWEVQFDYGNGGKNKNREGRSGKRDFYRNNGFMRREKEENIGNRDNG